MCTRRSSTDYGSAMEEMTRYLATELAKIGDPGRAADMARYMKTDMPFYGVPKPERSKIYREMRNRFPITSRAGYLTAVQALWAQPHREEKYCAIRLGRRSSTVCDDRERAPLPPDDHRRRAWWDFVDDIAARLVGKVLLDDRARMHPKLDRWIDDPNLWIRRTAILSQLKHKDRTDRNQLFELLPQAGRRERVLHSQGHRLGVARIRQNRTGWSASVRARTPRAPVRSQLPGSNQTPPLKRVLAPNLLDIQARKAQKHES